MKEHILLLTYTVADLKDWLIHNHPKEGLSSMVIAPTRAFAIINNPFVSGEMKVVSAIFVDNKIVAFTAAFPEILENPNGRLAWWFTTLWCDHAYEGRGFGLVVVGTLVEEYGIENCFDADGAQEKVSIMQMLGLETGYHRKYVFSEKVIHRESLKGKLAWCLNRVKKVCHYPHILRCQKSLKHYNYSLVYQQYLDEESYSFMKKHSNSDMFFRKLETFNWILRYPFLQTAPLKEKDLGENRFS